MKGLHIMKKDVKKPETAAPELKVSISPRNEKLGEISSISLPVGVSCRPDAPCFRKCYARQMSSFRSNVAQSYLTNWRALQLDRDTFFKQVKYHCQMVRVFRWHIGGDIPDVDYFRRVVKLAEEDAGCVHLLFTKRYDFVNEVVAERVKKHLIKLPKNLHVLFSEWGNELRADNPYHLSLTDVWLKKGTRPFISDKSAIVCPEQLDASKNWKCTDCFRKKFGCFAEKRQNIIFLEH